MKIIRNEILDDSRIAIKFNEEWQVVEFLKAFEAMNINEDDYDELWSLERDLEHFNRRDNIYAIRDELVFKENDREIKEYELYDYDKDIDSIYYNDKPTNENNQTSNKSIIAMVIIAVVIFIKKQLTNKSK